MKNYILSDLVDTDLEGFQAADPDAEETAYRLDGSGVSLDGGPE